MRDNFWTCADIAFSLAEAFIIAYFICGFLKHDFKTLRGKITYAVGGFFGGIVLTILNEAVNGELWAFAFQVIYWLLFTVILIKGRLPGKLLAVFIAEGVLINTENLILGLVFVVLDSREAYEHNAALRLLILITIRLVNLLVFMLIKRLIDKSILKMNKREWLLIISVFLLSAFSFGMIHIALRSTALNYTAMVLLLLSEIGFFLLNLICIVITVSLNKSNQAAENLKLQKQQLEHNIRYAETVRNQYQEIRNMRHDMKQHLAAVSGLQLEGKYDAAQKYLSEISSSIDRIEIFVDVGNDFVNAILNSKLSVARSKGIEVMCNSTSKVSGINEYDLCNLIGNMLDNAIEAAEKVDANAVIEIAILSDKYKLMITVSNSIAESVLAGNVELKTTKTDSELHGFGLNSIRSIAEKYNGSVDFYEEEKMFFCRVILGKDI